MYEFIAEMTTMVKTGLYQTQVPRTPSWSPVWMAGAQVLQLSCSVFPSAVIGTHLVGDWTGNSLPSGMLASQQVVLTVVL